MALIMPSQSSATEQQLIIYQNVLNPRTDFDQLEKLIRDSLNEKEKANLKDLKTYIVKGEDAWLLDQELLNFVGGLLEHRSLNAEIRVKLIRVLAAAACRKDFWSFLQMDRKERHLMRYPYDFDKLTVEEQKAVALFLCNIFATDKGSEWLMYGSSWPLDKDGKELTSNVKITAKVASFSLVSYTPSLQEYASAIIYNIALKETKALAVPNGGKLEEDLPNLSLDYGSVSNQDIMSNDESTKFVTLKVYNDVAMELTLAIMKFIKRTKKNSGEEILFRLMKSLVKFSHIIPEDMLYCIGMVQVDVEETVAGKSERIDKELSQLRNQLTKRRH